ncbi:MAG: NAD(P)H-dependent oxidoreductase subunit E [Clostridia bacterium]|nr:NAD(P)H-dependent oxidoreductase subunit E [Clostridia bacterium]
MINKLEVVPFKDTPEQNKQLMKVIDDYKNVEGALIQVLKKAQEIYSYLPLEVQQMVAEGMNIPLEEVFGAVTFYSFFSLKPIGKYRISVCQGTACYVKGGQAVLDEVKKNIGISAGETTPDGLFSIQDTRCLGCCGLAPVMTVNDDVYGKVDPKEIKNILAKYQ